MDGYLRQSTASQSRTIGPFIDDTDFKTVKTALTIANTDIKLMANGAASASKNSGGGTHRQSGHYGVTFDATDTATVGELTGSVVVAAALPVWFKFVVLEEAVYDALFVASAPGYVVDQPVNATKIGGTTQTGRDIGASVLLSSGTGTGQVKLSSGYVAPNWGDVGNPTTVVGLTGTTVKTATDVETDTQDIQARLPAALVSGRIDASVGAMAADTVTATAIATDALGALELAAGAASEIATAVRTELTTELARIDVATSTRASQTSVDTLAGYVDTEVAAIKTKTDFLPSATAGAAGGLLIAGSNAATTVNITGNITGNLSGSVGSVTGAVGSVTGNVGGNVTGSVGSVASGGIAAASFAAGAIDAAAIATDALGALELAAGTASEIATAVRTELTTELARIDVATSTRLASGSYTAPDNAGIATAAAAAASAATDASTLVGRLTSTRAGLLDNLDATVSSRASAANLATVAGYIDTEVGAIKTVTDKVDTALELDGSVYRLTANALEQAPTGGTAPTAVAIADEVQTRTIAGVTTVGTVNALAANSVNASAVAADAVTEIATGVWASGTRTLSSFGTLVADIATAVWAATTRLLTAGTNIVLAKGTGITGFNDLSAAQVNAEADTALADYDAPTFTELDARTDAIEAKVDTALSGITAIFARTDVATSTRLAAGSYTAPDNAGIGVAAAAAASAATNAATLVSRLTSQRATNLDNLDAAVTTRAVAGDAMALTTAERGAVADKLLVRSLATGSDEAAQDGRSVRNALRGGFRNRVAVVNNVGTVYQEDDTTPAFTFATTRAPNDPIDSVNPA